jgi:AmmeMemoRadiSam system protein B
MRRKAAVAGYFYPGSAGELRRMLSRMILPKEKKEKAIAVVAPHAGYVYSGPVAGAVYSSVEIPDTVVLLAPSHRPIRSTIALMKEGDWETPLGTLPVAADLAVRIMGLSKLVRDDPSAHLEEHSLEVQLPFLQFFKPEFSIVPISISYLASFDELENLGLAVARGIRELKKEALIVASTDMSHYISREEAKEKDFLAIQKVLDLDPKGLFDVVKRKDISMCGFQPTTSALVAAKDLGAQKAELIKYATSGDQTGDYHEVVGYAGIRIR